MWTSAASMYPQGMNSYKILYNCHDRWPTDSTVCIAWTVDCHHRCQKLQGTQLKCSPLGVYMCHHSNACFRGNCGMLCWPASDITN